MKKTLLILAALLCCCFALKAQDFTIDNLNYHVTSTNPPTVELTGPAEGFAAHNFVISSTVTYGGTAYSVTSIGNYSFPECTNLTGSLTIPNSVTNIGNAAFRRCTNLTGSLIIPNSVTNIGYCAFYGCSGFTGSLTIPNSVTSIGEQAFVDCSGFNGTLTLSSSLTKIEEDAFWGCSGFTGSLTIPNSVESIAFGGFAYCSGFNGTLTLSSSLTDMREKAFFNTNFTHIIAKPTTPPTLNTDAFSGMSELQSITVPCGKVEAYKTKEGWREFADKITGGSFQYDLTVASVNPELGTASITQYSDCSSGWSIVTATPAASCIFASWTENGNLVSTDNPYTFTLTSNRHLVANFLKQYDFTDNSTGLTLYYRIIDAERNWVSIVAPNSDDFYECYTGYDRPTGPITLPETVEYNGTSYTVKEIGKYAFFQCSGLTGSLTIPNSVTSIEKYAFGCCSGFTGSLTIGDAVTSIGIYAFEQCPGFTGSLNIGNAVESIGDYAFMLCPNFTGSLTIPNSVTSIGICAFDGCSHLTGSLTIPNSVTSIGKWAFNECSGFTGTLTIPNSVTSIGEGAFADCSHLTGSLTIPNSVESIGSCAFVNCSSFNGSLTIGNSVTSIGERAFYQCSGFTGSLTIPNSVESIGKNAFYHCSGFTGSLTIGNAVTSIEEGAFAYCSGFTGSLTIGNVVKSIGEMAFYDCSGFTGSLTIPNSMEDIGENAFTGCSGFTGSLIIPNSVESIGKAAFSVCSGFNGSLTIGNAVTSIGETAFYDCSGFTGSLNIPNSVESIGNYAFEYCSGLTGSLTIGKSLTSMGEKAFAHCNFTHIIAKPDTPPTLGTDAFYDMSELQSITVPCGKSGAYGTSWSNFDDNMIAEDFIQFDLTVASANQEMGTASITQPATCQSQQVTVLAMPIDGYKFINWTKNGVQVSTENPYTFSLNVDHNLVANFAITDQYDFSAICPTGQKLYYSIIDEEQDRVCIVAPNGDNGNGWNGFTKPTGQIELPETVLHNGTNYTVTAIGSYAFYHCNGLKGTLIIPNSVKSIGSNAFESCMGFTGSLNIPNSVEGIGDYAFARCSGFTGSLTIPNSVESIGDWAFSRCSGFTGSLTIPNSLLGDYSFAWSGFTGSLILGSAVTDIGAQNFLYTRFSQIVAKPVTPPSTTAILLVQITELQSIFVPCGCREAYGNSWTETASVIKEGSLQYDLNVASSNRELGKVSITQYTDCTSGMSTVTATPAENCWLSSWTENGEVVSRNNTYSFFMESDRNLVANFYRQWDFSATCTTGQLLYYRIIDAEKHWVSIVAPKSDDQYGWEGITKPTGEIELPETVRHNGTTYTVTAIGEWAFYRCDGLTGSLNIPNSVTNIGNYAFENCGFTGSLTIGNSVTSIGNNAFNQCSGFTGSLTIGNSVTSIGKSAFAHCLGFTGLLIIPNSVTSIGNYAFNNCSGFTGPLTIGNSVTGIGDLAFWGCSGFTGSLTISSSVERIGDKAFLDCEFANIISKAQFAPILDNYIPNASSKVYIPLGAMESYQNSNWGRDEYDYTFIEYNSEDYHFNGTNGSEWNTAANWVENQVPFLPFHNAFVNAECIFDATDDNATLHSVNVAAGKTLTIAEGNTLTADSITLENGAKLVNNGTIICDDLTVKKAIEGYGTGAGNWYLVSSPVATTSLPVGMKADPAEDYDLYRFDQTGDSQGREWLNYKAESFGIENQSGYLYANKNNTTIIFRGGFADTNTKTLAYDENAEFAGFNLVGNPYPCNATISSTNLRSSNYFYRMNADGTDLEVIVNPVLAPCTGVFAVATNSDATVTFTQASGTANVTRGEKSSLQDIRVELLADGKVIDRAYLNMNGESLPKFSLQDNGSEICFYQNKEELAVASTSSARGASTDASRGEMPLNFKAAKNGSYTITVNVDNADLNYLHLVDNLTGNDVDLMGSEGDVARNVSTYTFDAKTDDYASRFKLVFGVNDDAASAGSAGDFAYISNGEIIVSNEGRATLQVIDVMGRIVSSEEINGECRISTNGLTAGMYVLNLNGMTQKIVVK